MLLLVASGWSIYAYSQKVWLFTDTASNEYRETGSPQTPEQEAEESQEAKRNNDDSRATTPEKDEAGKSVVSVGIAFADINGGVLEVRAFTPSVVEGDGTCIAVLSRSGVTVSETSSGFIDSTTTQCEPIRISLEKFDQPGTWNLAVQYESARSQGLSETREVTIP